MIRYPWESDFPPVFANCLWSTRQSDIPCLKSHPQYDAAKGQRDMRAAFDVLDNLILDKTLEKLDAIASKFGVKPVLAAPAAQVHESNNALAVGYAHWLGEELGWPVDAGIFQSKAFSKDRSDAWLRMAFRSEFYGKVDSANPYVLVDDVLTMGGTLADLRSFIIGKGGSVIAMSVIASSNGEDREIHLSKQSRERLDDHYGPDFSEFCAENFGFQPECFTDAEASKLLSCSGYVELRKALQRARDIGYAQRRQRTG